MIEIYTYFFVTATQIKTSLMSVKPDTVTPVVRLRLLLAYWQDIYFGQLTKMALIFSVLTNLIWTMTEILPKKKQISANGFLRHDSLLRIVINLHLFISIQSFFLVLPAVYLFRNDKEPIGVIVLENSFVQLAEGGDSPFTFSIHFTCEGKSRVYKLTADDEVSCTKWVRKLSNSSYRYAAVITC